MGKLILVSILIATVAIPMRAATDPSPRRGMQRAILWMAAFDVVYVLAVVYVYPRLH
jgi:hypothetical protein